jgi:hypothetical protein
MLSGRFQEAISSSRKSIGILYNSAWEAVWLRASIWTSLSLRFFTMKQKTQYYLLIPANKAWMRMTVKGSA